MDSKKSQKVADFFYCKYCDYSSCKKYDFNKHLSTDKHKKTTNGSKMVVNGSDFSQKVAHYKCNCGKIYKYDSGYYRHKKKCNVENSEKTDIIDKDLVMLILKQNQAVMKHNNELQSQMMEVIKNGTTVHNTNSNNKSFNIQFFLNETCKDAMNLTDFVDSLHLQLTDLEKVGELGYVTGLSNIIINNLKAIELHKRPVHCSDTKRETIYIKDSNKWEKENDEKLKLNKAITNIANKNIRLIPKWKEQNPECAFSDSFKSDKYNDIIINSMDTDKISNTKIITNIAREIKIDKE